MIRATTGQQVTALLQLAVAAAAAELVADLDTDAPDPGPRVVPRDLRLWLARLRLLEGVPFGHLVADAALLPPESIRFFYVDRGWTDALVEGALSVGTVTTADRAALTALYPTVRDEVDEAERLVRLPGVAAGAAVPTGAAGTVAGFLLRSQLVSGWPALHVRGYARDNLAEPGKTPDRAVGDGDDARLGKLGLLRLERLAPAVLLVLFDGVPEVVHLEEPRAGVQFGVLESTPDDTRAGAHVLLRDPRTSADVVPETPVTVPFRAGAPGVMHLRELARRMSAAAGALPPASRPPLGPRLDSAEFALQMLRFPWRAVFGDRTLAGGPPLPDDAVFVPRLHFADLALRFGEDQ
ncbi:hypothetical protein EV189_2252 [Motilibacter rhizosphaerae]|uniref:Uncharacterized protein n=1 Tax=Motilibacter rhizosphaerae TaxID=598652 RepID=A0A4Q7NPF0_9ACTN|nr:hypothetical protein [Motilibacter rhizosphaerae]RZS86836.1 hypothetical protein EV189_2252 [Motilibacter rhizosphaerae]